LCQKYRESLSDEELRKFLITEDILTALINQAYSGPVSYQQLARDLANVCFTNIQQLKIVNPNVDYSKQEKHLANWKNSESSDRY